MKASAVAPANIAFIKYWGKIDEELRLPANGSISMNLDKCLTTTTVEFDKRYAEDSFEMIEEVVKEKEIERVKRYLSKLRKIAGKEIYAKVLSQNTFPKSSGIASSASGFAALLLAASKALGLNFGEKELTILARIGSGSACRSIPSGFVEWKFGKTNEQSYAYSLYPENYWDLRDILAIVGTDKKKVPTTEGMESSKNTSIFYKVRVIEAHKLLKKMKSAFKMKDFRILGEIIETDAIYMHCVMMSTSPALFYWTPKTLEIIKNIIQWREEGFESYFTIDAGPNVHIICEGKNEQKIIDKLKKIENIESIIVNKPAKGAHLINKHLF